MYLTWCWSSPHHIFLSITARDRIESRKSTSKKISQLIESGKLAEEHSPTANSAFVLLGQIATDYLQCLSQDLETGCLNLAVVKFLGVQIFKGDHNILIFQP